MNLDLNYLTSKVLDGALLNKREAMSLLDAPLEALTNAADKIRVHYCGWALELCAIINAKNGKCSEDCKFCAQSAHYVTPDTKSYSLMEPEPVVAAASAEAKLGVQRFSVVTAGRKPSNSEIAKLSEIYAKLSSKVPIKLCGSLGLLNEKELAALKLAGLTRVHNNLESSPRFFTKVCSTHTTNDKLATLAAAAKLNLQLCSGGILGLGESWEDRIDLALTLREAEVCSIPLNFLIPIPGTPFATNKRIETPEARRICALFRFINPKVWIRLAGGRMQLDDHGASCLISGANAMITGNMLTTSGDAVTKDLAMIKALGYHLACD